jgi:copper chaperone CopZ
MRTIISVALCLGAVSALPACHKENADSTRVTNLESLPGNVAVYRVAGMSCMGCVEDVTEALRGVPGVAHVEVNLREKRAFVTLAGESPASNDALLTALNANPSHNATLERDATRPAPAR